MPYLCIMPNVLVPIRKNGRIHIARIEDPHPFGRNRLRWQTKSSNYHYPSDGSIDWLVAYVENGRGVWLDWLIDVCWYFLIENLVKFPQIISISWPRNTKIIMDSLVDTCLGVGDDMVRSIPFQDHLSFHHGNLCVRSTTVEKNDSMELLEWKNLTQWV